MTPGLLTQIWQYWCLSLVCIHCGVDTDIISCVQRDFFCESTHWIYHEQEGLEELREKTCGFICSVFTCSLFKSRLSDCSRDVILLHREEKQSYRLLLLLLSSSAQPLNYSDSPNTHSDCGSEETQPRSVLACLTSSLLHNKHCR